MSPDLKNIMKLLWLLTKIVLLIKLNITIELIVAKTWKTDMEMSIDIIMCVPMNSINLYIYI